MEDNIRILIVEHDLDHLSLDSRILKSAKYEVLEARTGSEALEIVKAERPDMVLMDVVLPDMNGLDVCKRIRSDSDLSGLQVILMSSLKKKTEHRIKGLESGANGYILRPLSKRAFLARIAFTARIITAERKVRESEERCRLLLQNANDAIYVHAISPEGPGKFLEVNDRACQMLGYSREEFLAMDVSAIDVPEQVQRFPAIIRQLFETDQAVFETEHKSKNDHRIPVEVSTRRFQIRNVPTILSIVRDITDRKRMEKALLDSEKNYRSLIENANDIIYRTDALGHITFFNAAAVKFTGHAETDLIGKHFSELIRPDCRAEAERFYGLQFVKNIPNTYCELPMLTRDNGELWLGQNVQLIIGDSQVVGFHAIARDVTERRQAEAALRESEERYRTILDEMEEGYQEVDLAGNFTFFNEAFLRIFGYSRDEIMGTNFRQYAVEEEVAKKIYRAYKQMYETAIPLKSFEWDIRRKDGARRTLEFFASLLRDSNDRPTGFRGIVRDVTERRCAENALRESRRQLSDIIEFFPDATLVIDKEDKVIAWNQAMEEMTGVKAENILGKGNYEYAIPFYGERRPILIDLVLHPKPEMFQSYTNIEMKGDTLFGESYTPMLRGKQVHFSATASVLKDTRGEIVAAIECIRDNTEKKKSEEALRKAEEGYRSIFENAQEGIYRSTPEGKIIMANRAMAKMFGYDSPQELLAATTDVARQHYVHPEEREKIKGIIETHGSIRNYEASHYRRDGSTFWASVTMQAVRDETGRILYYEGIDEDITDRKESIERLRKSLGATVQAMAVVVETRDPYTAGHQRRVADLARAIATEMGLTTDEINSLRMAGIIHDLGKISVPAEILSKPTKLTNLEFSLIKTHAQSGYDILKDIEFPWPIARMVLEHHERMDGSGYPNGLTGAQSLLESRILSVADVVESMASHRPYRPALGLDAALAEITKNKAVLYDPEVVDACLLLFKTKSYTIPD